MSLNSEQTDVGSPLKQDLIHSIFQEVQVEPKLNPFWKHYPKTAIYGAGNIGQDVFRVLREKGVPVHCFFDRKVKQGSVDYWKGIPIYNLSDPYFKINERNETSIIVAIHNRDVEIPPIIEMLKSSGYGRVITLIDFYDYFGKELGNRFWLTSRAYYASYESLIDKAFSLWTDDVSRHIFKSILRFRLTGDYTCLPRPDMEHQYFPPDLPEWRHPLRFVDCGAYDGDTISYILANDIPVEAVAAFEPDGENFEKLAKKVKLNSDRLKNITLWPCGVYSSLEQMRFSCGQGEASMLSDQGGTVIQCIALDDVISDFAPNLIKMDIEGAEYEAILGAREIIQKYQPGLAISLYHRPSDLWQLPLLVNEIIGGGTSCECTHLTGLKQSCIDAPNNGVYRYCLRSHGFNSFDSVMYVTKAQS